MPKVVTVSVLIPEDYYTKAVELEKSAQSQSKSGGGRTIEKIKEETEQAVKNIVAGAIPMDPANPNPKQITVSSYVRIKETPPEIRTSTMDTVTSLFSQWGGAIGLGLFALWALWMLQRHDAQERGEPRRLRRHPKRQRPPHLPGRAPQQATAARTEETAPRRGADAHFQRPRPRPDDGPRQPRNGRRHHR